MNRKKVLVTGANGFIGRYVIRELLKRGVEIVATSRKADCPDEWKGLLQWKPLDLAILDDRVDYFSYFDFPDVLIHLAWEGLPNYRSEFHLTENLPRHKMFLGNIIRYGLKDLTVAGTCLEYGMKEGMLSEDVEPLPVVAYAKAKNELRIFLEALCAQHNVNFKWLRLFYMYGEGQNPNSLYSQLIKAIKEKTGVFNMSNGEQERDMLPVDKIAELIVKVSMQASKKGIVNICSGRPIKIKDFVREMLLERKINIKLNLGYYPYTDYEPMQFWGNNAKINSV